MEFDPTQFFSVGVAGVPLIFVVIGLVAWLKDYGLVGNQLRLAALLIGLFLGAGYQVSQGMPTSFAGWFAVLVYGIALGLVASKVYDTNRPKLPVQANDVQ